MRNPNPLWLDPLAERVQSFLDQDINPMVAGHGGHIDLLDSCRETGEDLNRAQHGEIRRRPIVAVHTCTLLCAAPSAAIAIVAKYTSAIQ